MNISLDYYNYFYYVAEFKSITKAANFLYVSQPAITKQIKKLEELLGKKLINRNNTGITLTNDGILLFNEIKASIENLNGREGRFKELTNKYQTEIRIVAGHTTIQTYLLPAMSKFNKLHPEIKFILSTAKYRESIQLLREGKVDLIFLSMKEIEERYNNIVYKKRRDAQDIFVVRYEDKDKYPDKINILDLDKYDIITLDDQTITRKEIERIYKENNKTFRPTYELNNYWIIEEYIKLGLGIGIVVEDIEKEQIKNKVYHKIETDINLPIRETGYAYRKNSNNFKVIKEFIDLMN